MFTVSKSCRSKIKAAIKKFSLNERFLWNRILNQLDKNKELLEVGFGKGGKTDLLIEAGFTKITGIEKNTFYVDSAKQKGRIAYTPDEFESNIGSKKFDIIVLSHIIEHFDFKTLTDFLDYYLGFLNEDGFLVIATPTLNPFFWHDLDHNHPVYPQGIKNFYSDVDEQVSFSSKYKLKLKDIYYRRSPFVIKNSRALMLKENDLPVLIYNLISAVVFKWTFFAVGRISGWIGLYRKIK